MTSLKESNETVEVSEKKEEKVERKDHKTDIVELPPTGVSLHKRRRGELPVTISVKSPPTSEVENTPFTAGLTPEEYWNDGDISSPEKLCDGILDRLKDKNDPVSLNSKKIIRNTKNTLEALDQLEKLLELLDQFVVLKERNDKVLKKLRDINYFKKLHEVHRKIDVETERLKHETKEMRLFNDALDAELEFEYGQAIFDTLIVGGKSLKRVKKGHSRFGSSLLRRQRSRSAGGDESDASPGTPLRRKSDGIFCKDVEKSKVSKWTRVKSAFRWEKEQWLPSNVSGTASAVAAGAMVGAVAIAGSVPSPNNLISPERDSNSLTPGSALSLTPNSSCEELRIGSGECRKTGFRNEENDTLLHAPTQDDSSNSPSPNKMHKSPWGKMRNIIQTRRESVMKKSNRCSKGSPDVMPARRRSFSDGGESDVPPALTLTIPSSEELESEPHHALRKQRSLELGARPPQYRPSRSSKWTKVKRAFLTSASASVPSSPNRHSAFFTDAETEGLSSGCEVSGVKDEIARDYAALQSRLRREFSDRRGKLYSGSRPVATEEQLSADFRKKLAEWQRLKGVRQPPPVPARQDLSDDFLKKWDEWKRMKETNSVPAWEEEHKPDEVLVKTSTGLFKFQGISRSFTRKLHEWEKSRGIAPEVSTSALLRAARASTKISPAPLARAQSVGSVSASHAGSERLHTSSLSVNDVDDFESDYERDHFIDGADECDGEHTRGAVLVEVEAEEICTAAPLMAVSPRHMPQKPVYTYDNVEARLLCKTSAAVTGTAVLELSDDLKVEKSKDPTGTKSKSSKKQNYPLDKSNRKKLIRQPSIEEDAKFIRKTIEEIEKASSGHLNKENKNETENINYNTHKIDDEKPSTSGSQRIIEKINKDYIKKEESKDDKKKEIDKSNGKKKAKSRARLEREQSKPSESDTELDVDTVTVEIPRRRKKPRRPCERPKTPPTSIHSDTEGEVFVLKLKAPEPRDGSPEVIVKTTRKIFSPVVRSGESVPRAVIPLNVEDLNYVQPTGDPINFHREDKKEREKKLNNEIKKYHHNSKSSGDLHEAEEQRPRCRPPLPSSPSLQRKPQTKETAPSIRIMIQRYNMKINEEGQTSGQSSGTSSPAWRSPATERRRPSDMPLGVNIRNNPFLEREVKKSASACQLSGRDQTSAEKRLEPTPPPGSDGVLKSHSAHALHTDRNEKLNAKLENQIQDSCESIQHIGPRTETKVPDLTKNLQSTQFMPVVKQLSDTVVPCLSRLISANQVLFERSVSTVHSYEEAEAASARLTDRAARLKAAREKFLSSSVQMRRDETSSTSDLTPGDRSSRISCESDVVESYNSVPQETALGRSASTGMVNIDRSSWQRVADGGRRQERTRSRFSFASIAAKLRRKDDSTISRLCRQSLLVQLKNK